jgi:hypothetical protein
LSPLGPHAAFTKDDCEDRQNEEEESSWFDDVVSSELISC